VRFINDKIKELLSALLCLQNAFIHKKEKKVKNGKKYIKTEKLKVKKKGEMNKLKKEICTLVYKRGKNKILSHK